MIKGIGNLHQPGFHIFLIIKMVGSFIVGGAVFAKRSRYKSMKRIQSEKVDRNLRKNEIDTKYKLQYDHFIKSLEK
ncbi:hypothetical protein ABH14_21285 [Brevibacillus brevis]|nr:hypothetical protein [Brevibacillus brevis]